MLMVPMKLLPRDCIHVLESKLWDTNSFPASANSETFESTSGAWNCGWKRFRMHINDVTTRRRRAAHHHYFIAWVQTGFQVNNNHCCIHKEWAPAWMLMSLSSSLSISNLLSSKWLSNFSLSAKLAILVSSSTLRSNPCLSASIAIVIVSCSSFPTFYLLFHFPTLVYPPHWFQTCHPLHLLLTIYTPHQFPILNPQHLYFLFPLHFPSQRGKTWVDILVVNNNCL